MAGHTGTGNNSSAWYNGKSKSFFCTLTQLEMPCTQLNYLLIIAGLTAGLSWEGACIRCMYKERLANFMFKRSLEPRYIDNRNLITREHRKKLMVVVKPNSEKVKNSLLYKGSKLWNSLTIAHQTCETYI